MANNRPEATSGERQPGAGHCGVADAARGETEPEARSLVQGVSLPGSQLEEGATGSGESGVPLRGTVPASRLHRDQPRSSQSRGSALLQQTRHGRAMDQGRQAGSTLDTVVVSQIPRQRGALAIERAGVQPGNLWRRLVLPKRIDAWPLTSLQQRLVKTGGRLVKHARYYWPLLAESHLTRRLFGTMLRRIWALPVPTG